MKKPSIKAQLIDFMDKGGALCRGNAMTLTKAQSAERRLREVVIAQPKDYQYFWAQPKARTNGMPYKIFFKKHTHLAKKYNSKVSIVNLYSYNEKSFVYMVEAKLGEQGVRSKAYKTEDEAIKALKNIQEPIVEKKGLK